MDLFSVQTETPVAGQIDFGVGAVDLLNASHLSSRNNGTSEIHSREHHNAIARPKCVCGEIATPTLTNQTGNLLSEALFHVFLKIASNTERLAKGLELIARQAHLMAPPMTVEDVAEHARVTTKTVYRWNSKGLLKPMADGVRPLLFDRIEVDEFLRKRNRGK